MSAPVKTYRSGKVKLDIWQGQYEGKTTYNFSITKPYKDKAGKWQNGTSYGKTDLKDVLILVQTVLINGINKAADRPAEKPKQAPADDPNDPDTWPMDDGDTPF